MGNSVILTSVRWGIRLFAVTSLLGVLLVLFLGVQAARREAIICAQTGRLYQVRLAIMNTIDLSGCPFTAASPNETWKRIVSREAFGEPDRVSPIFTANFEQQDRKSDIFAIRLSDQSPADCWTGYELICVELPHLFAAQNAPAVLTVDQFCDAVEAVIQQHPTVAESFVIVLPFEQQPRRITLNDYLERMQ